VSEAITEKILVGFVANAGRRQNQGSCCWKERFDPQISMESLAFPALSLTVTIFSIWMTSEAYFLTKALNHGRQLEWDMKIRIRGAELAPGACSSHMGQELVGTFSFEIVSKCFAGLGHVAAPELL